MCLFYVDAGSCEKETALITSDTEASTMIHICI